MSEYKIGEYSLKDIQNVMVLMMADIDRVCRDNNIRYILDGGTMLGAVRHKGFIPWDDDLDIAMPRDDYERFIEISNKELKEEYRFECIENTRLYPYNFGKVRAVNTVFKEKYTASLNICHGIYIDVFPMDYVDLNNMKKLKRIRKRISQLTQLRYGKLKISRKKRYIPFRIFPLKLNHFAVSKLMKYALNKSDGEYVQKLCHFGKNKPPININMFNNVISLPFENHNFLIPAEYDKFLTERYGDYMKLPPLEAQKPCHNIEEIKI